MVDICCIGHITLDKVVTATSEVNMPGGTSFYFSNAIRNMEVSYMLVTALAVKENYIVSDLRAKDITVNMLPSKHTVCFENIYKENQDHRTQRVLQKADPFTVSALLNIEAATFHLGPLLADDIPVDVIRFLSLKGVVSLDVQGYLREVRENEVRAIGWPEKQEALQYVSILKANDSEMEVLTGTASVRDGAMVLAGFGVKEVIITLGSKGSLIYADGVFYDIPAYKPATVTDATGCGDTYMAGYLYKKAKGAGIQEAGEFASAMAALKIESSGPFTGTYDDVMRLLKQDRSSAGKKI